MDKKKKTFLNYIIIIILSTAVIVLSIVLYTTLARLEDDSRLSETLEQQVSELERQQSDYLEKIRYSDILINNFNDLIASVYYGEAVEEGTEKVKNFTAFSLYNGNDFYLITAGHCIEYEGTKYKDFRFKANNKDIWIQPELITYESDPRDGRDYAIFYTKTLNLGLIPHSGDTAPRYVLGNDERKINIFKQISLLEEGESGSPILNSHLKVVGVANTNTGSFTEISIVLDEIPSVK